MEDLPDLRIEFRTDPEGFQPYERDAETLARPWAIPGTPGLEHRIGGLEKEDVTGNVSYDPVNHENMIHLRAEKVARIAHDIPDLEVFGDRPAASCSSSAGARPRARSTGAVNGARRKGLAVSRAHLRHLNPFPQNLGEVLARFDRCCCPR